MRRVKFLVDFPSPSRDQRAVLWRQLLPSKAPLAPDVDLTKLAEVRPCVCVSVVVCVCRCVQVVGVDALA